MREGSKDHGLHLHEVVYKGLSIVRLAEIPDGACPGATLTDGVSISENRRSIKGVLFFLDKNGCAVFTSSSMQVDRPTKTRNTNKGTGAIGKGANVAGL